MAVTIAGLSKTYPNGVKALNNIALTIGNNMFGLVGPNGAGKSTLMRTIATLQDPDFPDRFKWTGWTSLLKRMKCAKFSVICRRNSVCIPKYRHSTCFNI